VFGDGLFLGFFEKFFGVINQVSLIINSLDSMNPDVRFTQDMLKNAHNMVIKNSKIKAK